MAEGEEKSVHAQMAEIAQTDDQEKVVARGDENEKIAESENVIEGEVQENGDVKERGEEVENGVEVVKDGMEENGDAKKEEETRADGGIKNEDERALGEEEIVNGVKEKNESNEIDEENGGSKEENEKKNEEKDEPKQDEKTDRGNEENGELRKEDDEKNEGAEEKGEPKQEDEQKNKGDEEKGVLKEEDEIKNRGDAENDESKKQDEKNNEGETSDALPCNVDVNSSLKEEDSLLSELKENERMALIEIKKKLEEAIKENRPFKEKKSLGNDNVEAKGKTREKFEGVVEEAIKMKEEGEKAKGLEKQEEEGTEENPTKDVNEKKTDGGVEEEAAGFNMDISLWGVPLLPSKEDKATDCLLLKFLRARDFNPTGAFEVLRNTLQWRRQSNIDSVLNEDFANEFSSAAYMSGKDNEGHPVCYNIFGVLDNDEMYKNTLITEEKRDRFLRWRVQLMEKGIQQLDFNPNGVSCLLQVSDLKNTPGPSKKEVRLFARQGVSLLLDNYPEFVTKHIFINVPFWYYAFTAVLSPFLTPRTKSKFIYARPSKVTETLLKYIAAEQIPIQYGGLKRENDTDFSIEDTATEVLVKSGTTESIEIHAPEAGNDMVWDVMVLGWEVNYKEEFVPSDEGSYAISVQKGKRIGSQEGPTRNSFKNNEPGKVVISVENSSFKKRRVFYRYKIRSRSSS
ncbi:hypothetical protein SLE2022_094200 [Rubroshorea leprosula]